MPLEVLKAAVADDTVIQGQHWLAPLDIRTGLGMAGLRHQGAYQGRGRAWVGRLQVWTVDGAVIRWEKSRRAPSSYGDTPLLQPCNRATAPSRLNSCVVARLQKSVRQPCVALLAVWASACFKESGAIFVQNQQQSGLIGKENGRSGVGQRFTKVILGLDLHEAAVLPQICMHKGQERARFGVFSKSLTPNHLVGPGRL